MVRETPGNGGKKSPAGAFTLAALGTVAFLQTWLSGVNRADEVWFFSLAKMLAEGGVPYRDFSFHVLPGSLYLSAMLLKLVGKHIFVLKGLVAALVAGTIWLSARAFERLGGAPRWRAPFLLAGLLLSPALPGSAYGPMAYLSLAATLVVTLEASAADSLVGWMMASFLAAVGFVGKYNLGLLALGAVVGARCLAGKARLGREVAAIIGVFAATVVASLVPAVLDGVWEDFRLQAFGRKGAYLKTAFALPLAGKVAGIPPAVVFSPTEKALKTALRVASFATVGAGALAMLRLWIVGKASRRRWAILGFFLAAAFATAFPRFDSEHVLPCVPFALVPLALWVQNRFPSWPFPGLRQILVAVLAVSLVLPLVAWQQGLWRFAEFPGMAGARISVAEGRAIASTLHFARSLPRDQKVLFLGPYAAFYSMVTGLQPPTKYLFPLACDLGAEGQRELNDQLSRGEVGWVCLQAWRWPLRPALVEDYVTSNFRFVTTTGECAWFQGPQAPDAHKRGNAGF